MILFSERSRTAIVKGVRVITLLESVGVRFSNMQSLTSVLIFPCSYHSQGEIQEYPYRVYLIYYVTLEGLATSAPNLDGYGKVCDFTPFW